MSEFKLRWYIREYEEEFRLRGNKKAGAPTYYQKRHTKPVLQIKEKGMWVNVPTLIDKGKGDLSE